MVLQPLMLLQAPAAGLLLSSECRLAGSCILAPLLLSVAGNTRTGVRMLKTGLLSGVAELATVASLFQLLKFIIAPSISVASAGPELSPFAAAADMRSAHPLRLF